MSESYEIHEEKPDHHYRTEIPNIIDELPLSLLEFRLYCKIKRIAGDDGKCWVSSDKLAESIKARPNSVKDALKKLASSFVVIKSPLIKIERRQGTNGIDLPSLITICPIWRINGETYRSRKKEGGVGGQSGPPRGSIGTPKEEPIQEEGNISEEPVDLRNIRRPVERGGCCAPPNPPAPDPISFKEITGSFDPSTYILQDGKKLSLRTQRAFKKYTNLSQGRLLSNVLYYENQAKGGYKIKNHERFLQHCINEDLSKRETNVFNNIMYCKIIMEEFKYITIKKTMVKVHVSQDEYLGVDLRLDPEVFSQKLLNSIERVKFERG